jgi:hypothetical protein
MCQVNLESSGRQVRSGLTTTEVNDTKLGNKLRVKQGSKAMIGFDWGHPVVLSDTNIK